MQRLQARFDQIHGEIEALAVAPNGNKVAEMKRLARRAETLVQRMYKVRDIQQAWL